MSKFVGLLFLGIMLNGCTPTTYDNVYVTEHRTVVGKPSVIFSPQRDVMTDAGVKTMRIDNHYSSRSIDMTTPDVILGPGDYHQNRYSPSIFRDGRR